MKVINFIGQPSAGKTAMAAGLFYILKCRHQNVELVPEFTKDAILEGHQFALDNEIIVFTEKYRRIKRLEPHIDLAITDSSLLNSIFYSDEYGDVGREFYHRVATGFDNIYIFVKRVHSYVPLGRMPDEEKADAMAEVIRSWMEAQEIPFHTVRGDNDGLLDALAWLEREGIVPPVI